MTFDDFYAANELYTYDKTEHECMKMAWNAAIEAAKEAVVWKSRAISVRQALQALKTPLEGSNDSEVRAS